MEEPAREMEDKANIVETNDNDNKTYVHTISRHSNGIRKTSIRDVTSWNDLM